MKKFLFIHLIATAIAACDGHGPHLSESSSYKGDYFLLAWHYYQCTDYEIAFDYASKGAEKGITEAMLILKEAYQYGNGVSKNLEESMKWLLIAERLGNKEAKQELQKVKTLTSFKQVNWNSIDVKANYWLSHHLHHCDINS